MSDIFSGEVFVLMNRKINGHTGDFIKRQAKRIARAQSIPHHQALDQASVNAGFSNWRHFLNASKEYYPPMENLVAEKLNLAADGTSGSVKKLSEVNPYRNLLVAAVNELVKLDKISLDSQTGKQDGHILCTLLGFPSAILWNEIGYQEIRISVWWKYDHSLHPQANSLGNARENFNGSSPLANRLHYKKFVGVTASCWLERRTGKYIQGKGNKGIFDVYTRAGEKTELENLSVQNSIGYKPEGKFYF